MLNNSTPMTRPHAVADCRWVILAPTAAPAKGTGLSAFRSVRDRFGAAPKATALLPISDVVTDVMATGNAAGIRTWSPPV